MTPSPSTPDPAVAEEDDKAAESRVLLREFLAFKMFQLSRAPSDNEVDERVWRDLDSADLQAWRAGASAFMEQCEAAGVAVKVARSKVLAQEVRRVITVPERLAYQLPKA